MLANIVLCMLLAWLGLTIVMSLLASRQRRDITPVGGQRAKPGSAGRYATQPPLLEVAQVDGMATLAGAQNETPQALPVL